MEGGRGGLDWNFGRAFFLDCIGSFDFFVGYILLFVTRRARFVGFSRYFVDDIFGVGWIDTLSLIVQYSGA